jgi:hypothetical protein
MDLDRHLYDEVYLEANCNATLVLFDPTMNVDDTPATYWTNYAILAVGIVMGMLVGCRQRYYHVVSTATGNATEQHDDEQKMTVSLAVFFVSIGTAFGLAGLGHQIIDDEDDPLNQILPRVYFGFILFGNAFLMRVALILQVAEWSGWKVLFWGVVNVGLIAASVALKESLIAGIALLATSLLVVLTHIRQAYACCFSSSPAVGERRTTWRHPEVLFLSKAMSMAMLSLGLLLQVSLAPACGAEGYQNCFIDCPLPAPTFNHNALFHVAVLVALVTYGSLELWVPVFTTRSILVVVDDDHSNKDARATTTPRADQFKDELEVIQVSTS